MAESGTVKFKTLLTARLFESKEKHDIEFLEAHPVTQFPELYREVESGKRVVKDKCITTAYVTFLALMHQTDATTIGDFKYHDSGEGDTAAVVGNTGMESAWGGARDVGTQVASTNTYTSVATTTYNATKAITEHGLFNASSGVTLMDRHVFSAINVVDTNQIQWTYVLTLPAGS